MCQIIPCIVMKKSENKNLKSNHYSLIENQIVYYVRLTNQITVNMFKNINTKSINQLSLPPFQKTITLKEKNVRFQN